MPLIKKKHMNEGGEVTKTLGEMIGYPGSTKPIKKAHGGEVQEHYASIADAILAKKRAEVEAGIPIGDDTLGEDTDLADFPQPEDSNEHGDPVEDEPSKMDMVSAIRKKMKKS